MKCPKCRRDMKKKSADKSNYYFECPNCHYTIGKTTEVAKIEAENEENVQKSVENVENSVVSDDIESDSSTESEAL